MARFGTLGSQYFDSAGDPLINGKIYFFESGTDTDKDTFADVNLTIANTNPVILSGAGRQPNIFFNGTAKSILTDSDDVQIEVRDPVGGESIDGSFSPWDAATIYNHPDIVVGSDSLFYKSITNGNENNDPTSDEVNWSEVRFTTIWNANETYSINRIVEGSDGLLYTSLIDVNLNNDPTTDDVNWLPSTLEARLQCNDIINGGCQVSQRAAPSISATAQYGGVDRFLAYTSATPTAGTIEQAETTLLGSTGYALHISGLSTPSGNVLFTTLLESKDIQKYINNSGVFSCRVYHDKGSNVDYTITVNKADAKDDFTGGVTLIGTGSATTVTSATDTALEFAIADFGSCGNGIQIIVSAACGAVTAKNFYATEMQLEQALLSTDFEHEDIAITEVKCERHYEVSNDQSLHLPICATNNSVQRRVHVPFKTKKRTDPSIVLTGETPASSIGVGEISVDGFRLSGTAGTSGTEIYGGTWTADSELSL